MLAASLLLIHRLDDVDREKLFAGDIRLVCSVMFTHEPVSILSENRNLFGVQLFFIVISTSVIHVSRSEVWFTTHPTQANFLLSIIGHL